MLNLNKSIDSQTIIKGRPVLIWGARALGCGMCKAAERANLKIFGFIDSDPCFRNKKIMGYEVFYPEQLNALIINGVRPYIITASSLSEEILAQKCIEMGLKKNLDFCSAAMFCDCEYIIDIAGICNLRCPSCPRGNFEPQPKTGIISVDTFQKLVEKILTDAPHVNLVTLYNWGEPLLHPQLPELIRILRERKIFCSLSTNFNIGRDFEDVLRAAPDMLKVSLSGYYQSTYETTHAKGNINLVKSNLYKLRYLIDKHGSDLIVEVIYHKYKNNRGEDYEKTKQLCNELNFFFASCVAYFSPVEKIIDYIEGRLPEQDRKFSDMLLVTIDDALRKAQSTGNGSCPLLEKQIVINWDGSVSLCCASFDPEKTIVKKDFLSATTGEIKEAKLTNSLCGTCMKYGINKYFFETSQCEA